MDCADNCAGANRPFAASYALLAPIIVLKKHRNIGFLTLPRSPTVGLLNRCTDLPYDPASSRISRQYWVEWGTRPIAAHLLEELGGGTPAPMFPRDQVVNKLHAFCTLFRAGSCAVPSSNDISAFALQSGGRARKWRISAGFRADLNGGCDRD